MVAIQLTDLQWNMALDAAGRKADINYRSVSDGTNRSEYLPDNERKEQYLDHQVIAMAGDLAGAIYLQGPKAGEVSFARRLERFCNAGSFRDMGSDIDGLNVDFKSSKWHTTIPPEEHRLMVRSSAFRPGWVYALNLCDPPRKVVALLGWADSVFLRERVRFTNHRTGDRWSGGWVVRAKDLIQWPPIKYT